MKTKLKEDEAAKYRELMGDSYEQDGVNIVPMSVGKSGYCLEVEGERFIFVNPKLSKRKKSEFISWGFEQFANNSLIPIKEAMEQLNKKEGQKI